MKEKFDLQEYLTQGVDKIVRDAVRATLRNPRESAFMARYALASARAAQRRRFQGAVECNAHMGPREMEAYCSLTPEGEALMEEAYHSLGLTARSYDRILRVARTIADLAGSADIKAEHLAEAVQYRTYDLFLSERNGQ